MSLDKVGDIESLKQQLGNLEQNVPSSRIGYWHKLSVYCQKMSADQLKFVNSSKKVTESFQKIMEAFNLFMFEKYKEDFANIEAAKPLCENYINSILEASEEYTEALLNTRKENEELKRRLAELEKKQNGCNSKRT
jgi:BMFP domain-containing protein YqiC